MIEAIADIALRSAARSSTCWSFSTELNEICENQVVGDVRRLVIESIVAFTKAMEVYEGLTKPRDFAERMRRSLVGKRGSEAAARELVVDACRRREDLVESPLIDWSGSGSSITPAVPARSALLRRVAAPIQPSH